jgi:hypothetical protein
MERRDTSHDPHRLGVLSSASKTISEPLVHSTQTAHLSCVKFSTTYKRIELSLEPHHLGRASGASKMIPESMVHLAQKYAPILHRHYHCLQIERSEIPHDSHHLGIPLGASKRISKPMVRSTKTMHRLWYV